MSPELMTDDEQYAMELMSKFAGVMRRIIGDAYPVAQSDWSEAAGHIHNLQRMVMSQAAARAYPDRFRLLGGGPKS